jgi:hypothetical protein
MFIISFLHHDDYISDDFEEVIANAVITRAAAFSSFSTGPPVAAGRKLRCAKTKNNCTRRSGHAEECRL